MARISQNAKKPATDEYERIAGVWKSYRQKPNEGTRNRLMEFYLPIVRYNAERLHSKLPDEVDINDLMSEGIFGLMDAIDAYDVERGVKFETYCAPRIRGAMLDHLREMDWVPRLVRSRSKQLRDARFSFEQCHGKKPNDGELQVWLGVDDQEFAKLQKDGKAASVASLSRKWFETDSNKDVCEIDVLRDNSQISPLTAVQRRDLKDFMTKGLTRPERLIIILYYYEEMTMREVGVVIGLSESRVSQMHTSMLLKLKARLQGASEAE